MGILNLKCKITLDDNINQFWNMVWTCLLNIWQYTSKGFPRVCSLSKNMQETFYYRTAFSFLENVYYIIWKL